MQRHDFRISARKLRNLIFYAGQALAIAACGPDANAAMPVEKAIEIISKPSSWPDEQLLDAAEIFQKARLENASSSMEFQSALVRGLGNAKTEKSCDVLIKLSDGDTADINRAVGKTISQVSSNVDALAVRFLRDRFWLTELDASIVAGTIRSLCCLSETDVGSAISILQKITHKDFANREQWDSWWRAEGQTYSMVSECLTVARDRQRNARERSFALKQVTFQILYGPSSESTGGASIEKGLVDILHDRHETSDIQRAAYVSLCDIYRQTSPEKFRQLVQEAVTVNALRPTAFMDIGSDPSLLAIPDLRNTLVEAALDRKGTRIERACAAWALAQGHEDVQLVRLIFNVARDLYKPPSEADQPARMALASLRHATGQDFGDNIEKWGQWIDQNLPPTPYRPESPGSDPHSSHSAHE